MSEPAIAMTGLKDKSSSYSLIDNSSTVNIGGGTFNSPGRDINNFYFNQPNQDNVAVNPSSSSSIPNFREIQIDTLRKATDGTCLEAVEGPRFQTWIENGKMLWGTGIPGAGKTTLASIAIDHLEKRAAESDGALCVAYVFIRYSQPLSVRAMLEALVSQLRERHADVRAFASELYARHQRERTSPSERELHEMLSGIVKMGKTCFIVLDGLDETSTENQGLILRLLAHLDIKLLVLSRPLPKLQPRFPEAVSFRVAAQEHDIRLHIEERISFNADLAMLLSDPDFKEEVTTKITHKADGMFLHAALQLETLCECFSMEDASETLEQFPPNLEDAYRQTWTRIQRQSKNHRELANRAFLWVMHAKGEVGIETLRLMVATSPESFVFNPKQVAPEAVILSACCGLIKVDKESNRVRLVHFTAKDALEPLLHSPFPQPHTLLTSICLEHLINNRAQDARVSGFCDAVATDSLLEYAYESWAYHAQQSLAVHGVAGKAQEFLRQCTSYPLQLPNAVAPGCPAEYGNGIHVAAKYDFADCIEALTSILDPNEANNDWAVPLVTALQNGSMSALKALLALPHIDINFCPPPEAQLIYPRPWPAVATVLAAAISRCPDAIPLLLARPEIDVNVALTGQCGSPLYGAVNLMRIEAVDLLLHAPRIDVNGLSVDWFPSFPKTPDTALERTFVTPLQGACYPRGFNVFGSSAQLEREIVSHLLSRPSVDANYQDPTHRMSALMLAAACGRADLLELLLQRPDTDGNLFDDLGRTALAHSVQVGAEQPDTRVDSLAVVRHLLNHPGIDATIVPSSFGGETFHSWCLKEGFTEMAHLFEEYELGSKNLESEEELFEDALDHFQA